MRTACAALVLLSCASAARAQAPGMVPASPAWVSISTEELRAGYDTLWAVSDVHGRLEELEQLLVAGTLAVRDKSGELRWNPAKTRQLLVVVGDLIEGGRDSVGVVLLFERLQAEAAAGGNRIVVLLGNREVEFLAHPQKPGRGVLASAHRSAARLGLRGHPTGAQLAGSEFGAYLRRLPVAAFIGSWLFAHAGYVRAKSHVASLRAYFDRLANSWARGDGEIYRQLTDLRSIVSYHGWWKSARRRSRMRKSLDRLGLDGLVFGHDPHAFGAVGTLAMNSEGWLTKIDSGLKALYSRGMFLRCDVATLVRGTNLAMSENGQPTCRALLPDGTLHTVPVR